MGAWPTNAAPSLGLGFSIGEAFSGSPEKPVQARLAEPHLSCNGALHWKKLYSEERVL